MGDLLCESGLFIDRAIKTFGGKEIVCAFVDLKLDLTLFVVMVEIDGAKLSCDILLC